MIQNLRNGFYFENASDGVIPKRFLKHVAKWVGFLKPALR